MKISKLFIMLFGAIAMLFNLSSCGDDEPGVECCTFVDDGYRYRYCRDGTYRITELDNESNTFTGNWTNDVLWEDILEYVNTYNGSCD